MSGWLRWRWKPDASIRAGISATASSPKATGARPSTVRHWLNGRSSPTGVRAQRLVELAEMTDRLARVMNPAYIAVWLNRPSIALDDDKPVELLARGDYRRVAQLIAELEDPGVS